MEWGIMNNKEVHKRVKKEINDFLKSNGFTRQSSTMWIKERNELIQIIFLHFSYGQEDFNFDIAVQPFCVPSDDICLYISQRLSYFDRRNGFHSWGNNDEIKLMDDIKDAENVLAENVFPWFEKISDCNTLIKFLNSTEAGKSFHISPLFKAELLARLCFYHHHFIRANAYSEKFILMSEKYDDEKIKRTANEIKEMIVLSKTNRKALDNNFQKIIVENQNKWKLKK